MRVKNRVQLANTQDKLQETRKKQRKENMDLNVAQSNIKNDVKKFSSPKYKLNA